MDVVDSALPDWRRDDPNRDSKHGRRYGRRISEAIDVRWDRPCGVHHGSAMAEGVEGAGRDVVLGVGRRGSGGGNEHGRIARFFRTVAAIGYAFAVKVGHLEIDDTVLRSFCEKWGVAELAVFGSVLRDDFRPDSDIDFLVTWVPGRMPGYFDMMKMKDELIGLIGRDIDLAQRQVVEADFNQFRKAAILGSTKVVYAAA